MSSAVASRLRDWAERREVSVTAAVELAARLYLESKRRPAPRKAAPREVVRIRLPVQLHQDLRAAARAMPVGWSPLIEAAVMGLAAAEGLAPARYV